MADEGGAGADGTDAVRVVEAFNEVWGAHDLDGCLAMLTEGCVFDATGPAPDGVVSVGRDQIRAAWQPIFDDPAATFDVEEIVGLGNWVVQRWRYSWGTGHVRGIDLFAVVGDKINEKRSYVKG